MAYSVLALLSPLSFLGLTLLLYWRTARSLDPEVRKETRLAPFLLAPFLLPLVGILMWSALGSFTQCDALAADLRQLEAGDLERMTVLLNERSSPDSLFKDTPEGWQVEQRNALGRTRWVTLRFSDALDFTPDPESFAVAGQTYDWNWTHVQQYEIAYTTQFHLVASAVPVGGPL